MSTRCTAEPSAAAAVDCLRNLRRKTATELSSLGELLSQLSRLDEAVAAHERASRLRPTARRLQLLGEAHAAAGALDRATQTLSLAVRLAPTASAPYATLGYAHGRRERFVESLPPKERQPVVSHRLQGEVVIPYGPGQLYRPLEVFPRMVRPVGERWAPRGLHRHLHGCASGPSPPKSTSRPRASGRGQGGGAL